MTTTLTQSRFCTAPPSSALSPYSCFSVVLAAALTCFNPVFLLQASFADILPPLISPPPQHPQQPQPQLESEPARHAELTVEEFEIGLTFRTNDKALRPGEGTMEFPFTAFGCGWQAQLRVIVPEMWRERCSEWRAGGARAGAGGDAADRLGAALLVSLQLLSAPEGANGTGRAPGHSPPRRRAEEHILSCSYACPKIPHICTPRSAKNGIMVQPVAAVH